MNVHDLVSGGAVSVPWPLLVNSKKISHSTMIESETCIKKCAAARRCSDEKSAGEYTCSHGMSYFIIEFRGEILNFFGLRGPNSTRKLNLYNKSALKGRSASQRDIDTWLSPISDLLDKIEFSFLQRQSEMLDPLHDPIRIAKQINTIANKLVQQHSHGRDFDDQLNNSSTELKTLVKAADFLSDSFDLLAIYFNPEAASFGKVSSVSVHGLITKLVSIFRIDDGLSKEIPKIYIEGSCYRNVFAHESFKLIPFALLSNAAKYSMTGNINVSITDRRPIIEVSFESTGPYIEECEREFIFNKGIRGKWAEKISDGRGVGLYLASIIAKAHGFEIKVASKKIGRIKDDVPLASNRFFFEIHPNLQQASNI